jgi:hypothetical protein|nr:MAG TPA: hypothetical protein [Caudoviricetes sp.]
MTGHHRPPSSHTFKERVIMARRRTGYGSCKTTGGAVFTNLKGTKIHFPAKGYEKGENEFRGIPVERVTAVAILTGADLVQAIPVQRPALVGNVRNVFTPEGAHNSFLVVCTEGNVYRIFDISEEELGNARNLINDLRGLLGDWIEWVKS